jgi:hypothetical protein
VLKGTGSLWQYQSVPVPVVGAYWLLGIRSWRLVARESFLGGVAHDGRLKNCPVLVGGGRKPGCGAWPQTSATGASQASAGRFALEMDMVGPVFLLI